MKIILLQDVPRVGYKYDVKDVANGLARNFLIPRGYAELATNLTLKKIESLKEKDKKSLEEKSQLLRAVIEKLSGQTVIIKARVNEQGSLFASVTKKEIVSAIKKQFNIDTDEKQIILKEPVKKIGEYEIGFGEKENNINIKIKIETDN